MAEPARLPIFEIEDGLVAAVAEPEFARVVIEAPTGSGKSTQVPQMLIDRCAIDGEVVVLQPRRLAARMLAGRVAWERRSKVGGEVGYQIRFEDRTGPETRVRFITEGILLRQLLRDPTLSGVGAVVFDEFHERHFFGDVTLARLLEVQETDRPDLKIIVMSATLEAEALTGYLDTSTHLVSEGRTFPVETAYAPAKQRHNDAVWDHVARVMGDHFKANGVEGHSLVFLPGAFEIRKTIDAIQRAAWSRQFDILPLYGELSTAQQDAAVGPSNRPKIVVATNVAETSITIDGVRLVVDAGLERRSDFDVRRGISTLRIEKISRASSDQRAGRAGRTGPGVCIRLWSAEGHAQRAAATPAEIHRMDLSEAVIMLKASGIDDVRAFRWFEPPERDAMDQALDWLVTLGALDVETQALTELGREMSRLPLNPRYARVLIAAAEAGCLDFFALAAAATQGRPLFARQKKRASDLTLSDFMEPTDGSDFQAVYRAWSGAEGMRFDRDRCQQIGVNAAAAREIGKVAAQFSKIIRGRGDQSGIPDGETIGRIMLQGFSDRVSMRLSEGTLACAVVGRRRGTLEKESVAAGKGNRLFIAGDIVEVEGRDVNVKLSLATRIEEAWLEEVFPKDLRRVNGAVYDETNRRVEAREEVRFRDLVLSSRAAGEVPLEEAAALFAEEIAEGRLILKKWDRDVEQWIARLNTIAQWLPEYEIAPFGEAEKRLVLEEVCSGGLSYKQIKDRPVKPILKDWLPPHQAPLIDKLTPERVTLETGRGAKIIYDEAGGKPKISVLIQHLFGIDETPTIAGGRIPLMVEILAPNSRPCQTTEDLAGFWRGSYAGVRSQLRGRYPKHEWPEPKE